MSMVSKMAVAVALVAMAAPAAKAADKQADQAAVERSWALQAELARIEGDKEAFVDEMLAGWAPVLGRNYDVQELKSIAMAAYPWRLYGASLVGDFDKMVGILRGAVAAGPYINKLDKPEPKVGPGTKVLGSLVNSLVYTPIAPCRIVDTRGTGARTGILAPGGFRSFDLTTEGLTEGQGGDTTCPGLPSFSHFGWDANVTVTGHVDNGGLQVWGFTGPIPSTSLINFYPAGYAIANNGALTGCSGCIDDISVSAFGGPSHVIIDVMGYFEQATGFAAGATVVTSMSGTSTSIPANTLLFVTGAACPAGTVLIGGTQTNGGGSTTSILTSDHSRTGTGNTTWYEFLKNTGASAVNATVSSLCIDVN